MRRVLLGLTILSALLVAFPAGATQKALVKLKFVGDPRPAGAGEAYRGAVELIAGESGDVSNLRLEGEGWSIGDLNVLGDLRLDKQERLLVAFEATPSDPTKPLYVVFSFGGREVRRPLDLSPGRIARLGQPRALAVEPPGSVEGESPDSPLREPPVLAAEARLEPVPARPRRPGQKHRTERLGAANPLGTHNVYVHGRFRFKDKNANWTGAHGVTVRIYDEDVDWDEFLGSTLTDANGYWAKTVTCSEDEPDIYMEFEAANSAAVIEEDTILEDNYVWTSGVHDDFGGSDLNHGNSSPSDADLHPALYILNNLTRTWSYFGTLGYNVPQVDCQFVETSSGTNSFYDGEIHIRWFRRWNSGTQIHEYGHHWMSHYATGAGTNYCNGVCDTPPNCGHCIWCQETADDAWNEGFPDWLGDVIARWIEPAYGATLFEKYNFEKIDPTVDTDGNPCNANPLMTEGFFAALLRDIEDATQDNDLAFSTGSDALNMGADEIIGLADNNVIYQPGFFIGLFKSQYPASCEGLWQTAQNNGFNAGDDAPPSIATNLDSPSHGVGLQYSYTDGTIDFTWTRAFDDCSGTAGYSVLVSPNAEAMPNQTQDIADVTSFTTQNLGPGIYFFNIRARDKSGKWSAIYAYLGPFQIRDPYPADLAVEDHIGWDYPVVPHRNIVSQSSVPAPAFLTGNQDTTLYSWNVANVGELANNDPTFAVQTRVDGEVVGTYNANITLAPGAQLALVNFGPITVRGGRHTFEVFADAGEELAEQDENDNRWAKQWVWTPLVMGSGVPVIRSAPPNRTGGWAAIPDPDPYDFLPVGFDNCDGLRIGIGHGGTFWRALAMHPLDNEDDYELALHVWSAGAEDGFTNGIEHSTRPAGELDALLVNDFELGSGAWDVGVVKTQRGASDYAADEEQSMAIAVNDSVAVGMGANEMIKLFHFGVPVTTSGEITATLVSDSTQPLTLAWFDRNAGHRNLDEADEQTTTDAAGKAKLTFLAFGAQHCIAVYRHPKDGTAPITFKLKLGVAPSEFAALDPQSNGIYWPSSLVPAERYDGSGTPPGPPALLLGDGATTWLNLAFENRSPYESPAMLAEVCVDDSCRFAYAFGPALPGGFGILRPVDPVNIPAGRHVLALHLDADDRIAESDEGNNGHAEQYVWIPGTLPLETPVVRNFPGDPTAGWELVPESDEPLWYNVDGFRTPVFAPGTEPFHWAGVAVMPGAGSDVDLRLFELATTAKSGFDSTLAYSGRETGISEYLLVNFGRTGYRAFDFGVQAAGDSEDSSAVESPYTVEVVGAVFRGGAPDRGIGPFTLGARHILHLHEFLLAAGPHAFRLTDQGGNVDWGITLHPLDETYPSKSDFVRPGANAWDSGPGLGEAFTVYVPDPGYYCLAVWKRSSSDLDRDGTYMLDAPIYVGVTPGDQMPARTALAPIYPNPFGSRATVAFDLAEASDLAIDVYDMRGARVSTLARGPWPAGRHHVNWDTEDSQGRRVANGLYVVRMAAAGFLELRKVAVLK